MDWEGHAILGLRAAQGLPQWEIDTLQPDMSPEEIGKVYMPPITNVREKLGAYCLILDWIYQSEYASYARRPDGSWAVCYWHTESNLLTQTYEGTVTLRLPNRFARDIKRIDLLSGDIYQLPEEMVDRKTVLTTLRNLPIRDYPLLLTFGDFYRE